MAATGKTPILLYGSTTPTNQPSAGNLTNSSDGCEIAINVADKNLFFKDSTNTVNTVPIRQSSASSNGWLSSTDWSTFNSKQPAGTYVTSVTGTAPVVSSGGTTPAISMAAANGSTNGYLTSTDWTTFNNKQAAGSYALTTGTLAQFASTTSAQLAGVISDETGSGLLVFGTSPSISTPTISGGTINNTTIGATTATTGKFTNLTVQNSNNTQTTLSLVNGTGYNSSTLTNMIIGAENSSSVDGGRTYQFNIGVSGVASGKSLTFSTVNSVGTYQGMSFTGDGNLAFVSGKGIDFSATAGTGTSELLADYEEGTFTPSVTYTTPGTVAVTYAAGSQVGQYVKVGKTVTVNIDLRLASFSKGTASGSLIISGFPYAFQNTGGYGRAMGVLSMQNVTFTGVPITIGSANSAYVNLYTITSGGTFTALPDPTATSQYFVTLTYLTD